VVTLQVWKQSPQPSNLCTNACQVRLSYSKISTLLTLSVKKIITFLKSKSYIFSDWSQKVVYTFSDWSQKVVYAGTTISAGALFPNQDLFL